MRIDTPVSKLFQEKWSLPENPFQFLGAENYRDEQILSLFEIDRDPTIQTFSLQNSIIEGTYGTGKTMLLKAIYQFYYSKMIVDIAERQQCGVIPVFLKFADLPYKPENIYREIILYTYRRILETRGIVASFLSESGWFYKFKFWLDRLTKSGIFKEDKRYSDLSAETVTSRIKESFKSDASVGGKWLKSLSVAYEEDYEKEVRKKENPGIVDIENLFNQYFKTISDRILFLIDESESLPADAFNRESKHHNSLYETLLNQFRTSRFIIYKIAVYPNSRSSKQLEGSRIGNRVRLGFDIKDSNEFSIARDFFYRILKSYLSNCAEKELDPQDYFMIQYVNYPQKYAHRITRADNKKYGDSLEQLVFGSNGIVRRLIKLAGDSMLMPTKTNRQSIIVTKYDVFDAMRSFGRELIERLNENERALVDRIALYGMRQMAFRFRAPGRENLLQLLHEGTKQDNVLYPVLDQDRHGITYIFELDYCYCMYRNVPTHSFFNLNKVNQERSLVNGKWLLIPVSIPKSYLNIEGRLDGEIKKYIKAKGWGFISYLEGQDLYFHKLSVRGADENKIQVGTKVSFRVGRNNRGECAEDIRLK